MTKQSNLENELASIDVEGTLIKLLSLSEDTTYLLRTCQFLVIIKLLCYPYVY